MVVHLSQPQFAQYQNDLAFNMKWNSKLLNETSYWDTQLSSGAGEQKFNEIKAPIFPESPFTDFIYNVHQSFY